MDDIPYGYCHCGCGLKTNIPKRTYSKRGWFKGVPQKFYPGHFLIRRNQYAVSHLPFPENFWFHVDKRGENDCWEWLGQRKKPHEGQNDDWGDYGIFDYRDNPQYAHRVSYELAYGSIPDGLLVLHKCDNPPCVNPNHLFLGTDADNNRDMISKGRNVSIRGSQVGISKLTEEQVVEIKRLLREHVSYNRLMKMFDVSKFAIYSIAKGKTWKHIA